MFKLSDQDDSLVPVEAQIDDQVSTEENSFDPHRINFVSGD